MPNARRIKAISGYFLIAFLIKKSVWNCGSRESFLSVQLFCKCNNNGYFSLLKIQKIYQFISSVMTKDKKKLSRRKFIKTTGFVATGISIVPRHVLGGNGFTAPSDKLNIAGVGVGGRGNGILNAALLKVVE